MTVPANPIPPQESPKAPEKKPSRWSRLVNKVGTALGEQLFGGNR